MAFYSNVFAPQQVSADPDYSYDIIAQQIAQRKALADAMRQNLDYGKVRVGKGTATAGLLGNALSGYLQGLSMKQDAQNVRASQDAYEQGRALLSKTQDLNNYGDAAKKAADDNPMAVFTYARPQDVGPQAEPVAQAFPVKPQSDVVMRPLASAQPSPKQAPVSQPVPGMSPAAALAQAKRELLNDPSAPVAVGEFNTRVQQRANELMAPKGNVPVIPAAALPQVQAALQAQQPPAVQPGQAPEEPAPQQPGQPTFNVDLDAAKEIQGKRASVLSRAIAADREAAMRQLDRSGPRGRVLVQAIEAAQLKDKGDEWQTTSLGDGQFVTTNKRTGQTVAGGDGTQAKASKASEIRIKLSDKKGEAMEGVNSNQRALDAIDRAEAAVRKYQPKMGGVVGNWRLGLGKALGERDAQEFVNALDGVAISNLKSMFGGNTSNVELERLAAQFGTDGTVPMDVLLNKLQSMRQAAINGRKTAQGQVADLDAELDLYPRPGTAPKAAAPQPQQTMLDWKR